MLHVISARCVACDLHMIAPDHLRISVADSWWLREEIVDVLNSPFQCDNYRIIIIINVLLFDNCRRVTSLWLTTVTTDL